MISQLERDSERKNRANAFRREIGKLETIHNRERRTTCLQDVVLFSTTYLPLLFTRKFSKSHLSILRDAQRTVEERLMFAYAMYRGGGKSTIMMALVLWAILSGRSKYVVIITSEITLGHDFLQTIADELQDNETLLEDFPELKCFVALDGEPRRQGGQTVDGKKTKLRLSPGLLRFPLFTDNPDILSSSAVIEVKSITSRIRGRGKRINGKRVRPDFIIMDDIQTDSIAESPIQVAKTLRTIRKTILGLAGAGNSMAIFFIGTVIQRGDVCDTLLDHRVSPEWGGRKVKMLPSLPIHLDWWENEYKTIRDESLIQFRSLKKANAFYRKHRRYASEGAQVSWKECYEKGRHVDALQYAMELYLTDKEAFFSERQNSPLIDESVTRRIHFDARCMSLLPRRTVPTWAKGIFLGVDVGKYLAYYVVVAVGKNFTAAVVDWGTFPQQDKTDFIYDEDRLRTWTDPRRTEEENVSAGLTAMLLYLELQEWKREDGTTLRLAGGLVDGGYKGAEAVVPTLQQPSFYGRYYTAFGKAPTVLREQFFEHRQKTNEQVGQNLILVETEDPKTRIKYQYVKIYVNEWKNQLSQMCALESGSVGAFYLWGKDPARHEMYIRHLMSEFPTEIEARGIKIQQWSKVPNTENHLLDATVYALGAASIGGCEWNRTVTQLMENQASHPDIEIE